MKTEDRSACGPAVCARRRHPQGAKTPDPLAPTIQERCSADLAAPCSVNHRRPQNSPRQAGLGRQGVRCPRNCLFSPPGRASQPHVVLPRRRRPRVAGWALSDGRRRRHWAPAPRILRSLREPQRASEAPGLVQIISATDVYLIRAGQPPVKVHLSLASPLDEGTPFVVPEEPTLMIFDPVAGKCAGPLASTRIFATRGRAFFNSGLERRSAHSRGFDGERPLTLRSSL